MKQQLYPIWHNFKVCLEQQILINFQTLYLYEICKEG